MKIPKTERKKKRKKKTSTLQHWTLKILILFLPCWPNSLLVCGIFPLKQAPGELKEIFFLKTFSKIVFPGIFLSSWKMFHQISSGDLESIQFLTTVYKKENYARVGNTGLAMHQCSPITITETLIKETWNVSLSSIWDLWR